MKLQEFHEEVGRAEVLAEWRASSLSSALQRYYLRILGCSLNMLLSYEVMRFDLTSPTDSDDTIFRMSIGEYCKDALSIVSFLHHIIGVDMLEAEYNETKEAHIPLGDYLAKIVKHSSDAFYMLQDSHEMAEAMSVDSLKFINRDLQLIGHRLGLEIGVSDATARITGSSITNQLRRVKQLNVKSDGIISSPASEEDSTTSN